LTAEHEAQLINYQVFELNQSRNCSRRGAEFAEKGKAFFFNSAASACSARAAFDFGFILLV
jgi:hypothetical protein